MKLYGKGNLFLIRSSCEFKCGQVGAIFALFFFKKLSFRIDLGLLKNAGSPESSIYRTPVPPALISYISVVHLSQLMNCYWYIFNN